MGFEVDGRIFGQDFLLDVGESLSVLAGEFAEFY
jgi:hypothetical protein